MEIKLLCLQNAINAAKELGLNEVPWVWLKYMQSGWIIEPKSSSCGGNWVWLRPRPFGPKTEHGCVCHNRLELSVLTNTKMDNKSSLIKKALKKAGPTTSDVGKIFYTLPESDAGVIISQPEFVKLDPVEIGWWIDIDELDI